MPICQPLSNEARHSIADVRVSLRSSVRASDLSVVAIVAAISMGAAFIPLPAAAQVSKPAFKVAYIPCGRVNDQSWSQAGYEGVLAAQKELGIQVAYSESTPPADVEAAARDYATKGFNLVMLHCGTFTDAGVKVAKDFPTTWFEVTSASEVPKNAISINLAQQEGTFVAGVLAALTTKTNRLGAIAAYNTLGFNRQIEGFRLGAKFANPKIDLYVTYLNSAEDAAKAKEAALAQYDADADIILAATDQAATGVFQAATERGKFVIAEYANLNAIAPKAILASVLYNQARLVQTLIESVVSGTAHGEIEHPGISAGVGTLVENENLSSVIPPDARKCTQLVFKAIEAGTLRIPSDEVLGRQNAAKTIDPKIVLTGGSNNPCYDKRS